MENRSYALPAGLFVLVLLALLIGAILWFNDRGHLHGALYDLITHASVAGLTVGANVSLRGVEVGQVQSIQFDADDPSAIRVRISIAPKFVLRKRSFATLNYQGLTGDAYVELDFPSQEREPLATSAEAPARIPLRLSAWAALPETGEQFLTSFTNTLGRVDSILSPQNAQQLSYLLVAFSAAADQVTAVARDLQPAARRLDKVSADADGTLLATHKTVDAIDTFVVDAKGHLGAVDELGQGAQRLGLAAQDVDQALVRDSLPKLGGLLEGLSQNSDTLQELLEQLKQRPQSILFGEPMGPPGPGEPGFQARRAAP